MQESLHKDVRINVNGRELQPDDELAFSLQESDRSSYLTSQKAAA